MVGNDKCTGCNACYAICPTHAIEMKCDSEGFLQPQVNNAQCTSCGLCDKVCPVGKEILSNEKLIIACRAKNPKTVLESSSGGIFSVLAESVLSKNGVVYGCEITDPKHPKHVCIENKEDLDKIRRSKYVQSDKEDVFVSVKKHLAEGKEVMFVGTPCEVAGLSGYLGKKYDKLLLVDFICHGVPSPMAWRKYIEQQEAEAESTVLSVNFRSKCRGWRLFSMELTYDNGKKVSNVLTKNDYLRAFLCDLFLRKSCYNCCFKDKNYYSDLTIADFFAVNRIMPEIDNNEGTSIAIAHTDKGKSALEAEFDNIKYWELDDSHLSLNMTYFNSPKRNFWREKALREMHNKDFRFVTEKYCGLGILAKIRRKISKIIMK